MVTLSRRELMQMAAAAAVLPRAGASTPLAHLTPVEQPGAPAPVVAERVAEALTPLPFESLEMHGPLAERLQVNAEGRLLHVDEHACLTGFTQRDTAGSFDGAWMGEHAGKFLDAACNAVRYREQPELRRSIERMARALIASQAADGYLGTYPASRRWTGWDVWVHKYNLIGLLSYYELSADRAALRACRGMGDLLVRTFGDAPGQRAIVSAGEHLGMAATSVLEPMCRLYRFTGEGRYLDFCEYLVRAYDHPQGPRIVTTLLSGGGVYRVANAKAYEMLSNLNGVVDLYRLTADAPLLSAVLNAWDDIVRHQLYRTGTASAAEHFQPPGRLLTLQSSNVGEMCVTVTWLQLNWRLWRLTGEARFGEQLERTVYNHLLAAQDAGNGNISYYTAWAGPKEFTDALLCCVSSGPRGISLIPQLAWGLGPGALHVNLYGAGGVRFRADGVPVEVLCTGEFPSEGRLRLTVKTEQTRRFALRLRVPEWSREFRVHDGSRTLEGRPGQLLDVVRDWPGLSTLDIHMQLPTRVVSGAPTYPDYVWVERGPQLLALEQALNPTVPDLHRVALTGDELRVVAPHAHTPPAARQVYTLDGVAGVPTAGGQLRLEARKLLLVPFADLSDGCIWINPAGAVRRDPPPLTAFARVALSVVPLGLEPIADGHDATDIAEFVTDENPHSYCTLNPRAFGLANYLGAPRGERGDPVWFAVILKRPATIGRVRYRHGAVSAAGGWFDTSERRPRIEVARAAIPVSANCAVPDDRKIHWEHVADLDHYPQAGAATPPPLSDGQLFEVLLPRTLEVHGLRVVGRAGGEYASCAELSAYG
jgi:uncharacterized protein